MGPAATHRQVPEAKIGGEGKKSDRMLHSLGGWRTPHLQACCFCKTQTQLFLKGPKSKTRPQIPQAPSLSDLWNPRRLSRLLSSFSLIPWVCLCCWCRIFLVASRAGRGAALASTSARWIPEEEGVSPFPQFKIPSPKFCSRRVRPPPPPKPILSSSQTRLIGLASWLPC